MPSKSLCTVSALGIILFLGLLGCSRGGSSPIAPGLSGTDLEITPSAGGQAVDEEEGEKNRHIWGMWQMNVDLDRLTVEPVPLREAAVHLNIVGYLENPPGTQLLKIVNVSWSGDDTLLVDIQLIHPFSGKPQFTGRDVRGIAIFDAVVKGKLFYATQVIDVDKNIAPIFASRTLLNADGYTTLWNRWMHEQVIHPDIFGYIRGKLASPDEYYLEGNLHGFRAFWTDPMNRVFQSNQAATRTYELDVPLTGTFSFAYAVDASWAPPINTPVTDVWNDFPISANCAEPFQISASIISNTLTRISGSATVQFDVFDWQDPTNFSHVHVEAPDLFAGPIDPGAPIGFPGPNAARYEVIVPNTTGMAVTAQGGTDLLVVVEDAENTRWITTVNPDLTAYNIFKLPVADVPAFWRDRHGNGSFVNAPLAAPLIEPSTLSTGQPDLTVVSYPVAPYAVFGGDPEIMMFDDDDQRFIVIDRELDSTWIKSGYPGTVPPSWLLFPHSIDSTIRGWFAVGSTSKVIIPGTNYRVKHLANVFRQAGYYGFSWQTGTDHPPVPYLELLRDITGGFGNLVADPIYALFAYDSGILPATCGILSIGSPYIDQYNSNTRLTTIPRSDAGGVPDAVYQGAEHLLCAIDTDSFDALYYAFYVLEADPTLMTSEVEGFKINFSNIPYEGIWRLSNADINAEFAGAWALDLEVVPSAFNGIITMGDQTAEFNWLCVLMRDAVHYWLAFYDPVNPSPDNPGNNPQMTIYTSNKIPIPAAGYEPVAMDVDHQFFEVYVLCRDPVPDYAMTAFEFFY